MSTTFVTIRPAAPRTILAALAAVVLLGLTPGRAAAAQSPSISFSPNAPKTGESVSFSGSASADSGAHITSTTWSFGDGGTAGTASATHTFTAAGTYTVTFTVTEEFDPVPPPDPTPAPVTQTATATVTVVDNVPPTASFTFSPAAPNTGQQVTFRSTSSDPDGTIRSLTWDLDGNGSFGDSAATSASTTFSLPGPHAVSLRVTDNNNAVSAVVTKVVNVNALPVAGFTITPTNPLPGTGLTLTSTSADIDGSITAWAWDLDADGQFDDASTPTTTTTFLTAGTYKVGLRVTDNLGAVATLTQDVIVDQPPVAAFTFSPAAPLAGQAVTFKSTSTDADGTIAALDWDLTGNGVFTDATGPTATKVFTESGDAIVRLRVTDNRGVSAIAAMTVPVGGPPVAGFTFSPTSPTAGRPVTFSSTSKDIDGAIVSQQWDLDNDGLFSDAAGPAVQHTFATAGTYTVALKVTDTSGLTATAFQSVVVGPAAPAGAAPRGGAAGAAPRSRAAAPRPARLLLPFPIVRIAGRVTGRSTRIQLLEIRAPIGARVRVRCKGPGCPRKDLTAVVRTKRPVRFKRMVRQLRAGAVVEVFVRANGRIGKYTRFKIRRNRAPLRSDLCLPPSTRRPAECTA